MMECKKALVESNADIDAAAEWLRKAGAAKADKKSSRVAAEGRIAVRSDEKTGRHVVLEVNSETDFVAKDDNFRAFVDRVAEVILAQRPASVEELMKTSVGGKSVEEQRLELVTKVGENISVRRFDVVESRGNVGTYVHGSRIGVVVDLGRQQGVRVAGRRADRGVEDTLGERDEVRALRDEVRLRVDLDQHAGLTLTVGRRADMSDDEAVRGRATLTLADALQALDADELESLLGVALRLLERLLDVHHSGTGLLAQRLDVCERVVRHRWCPFW
jgi:hypothetical protein